jgi:hypothetical protein
MSTPQQYIPLSQLDQEAQQDLQSGNYAGAFGLGQQQQVGMYNGAGTGKGTAASNRDAGDTAPVTITPSTAWTQAYGSAGNNLLNELETPAGLSALDPNQQWTQQDVDNYYAAAQAAATGAVGAAPGSAASMGLGADPASGEQWGNANNFSSSASTNWADDPNSAPNLAQFGSMQPTQSLAEKYAIPAFDALYAGLATAGIGSAVGAAIGGGLGGAIGGGAAAGAGGSLINSAVTGGPVTLGSVGEGAIGGGLTGGLAFEAAPLTGAISNATGLSSPVSAGIVKGGIGAGVGALGADVSGGNVGDAALNGGASGFASGAVGNATGNAGLGAGAGTIAGLATRYLTSPSSPAAPAPPAATPAASAPAAAAPVAATNSAAAAAPVTGQATPTPAPSNSTTNIGAYPGSTGLGYQPRTQVNPNISNYNTYGQGPEASFYAPTPGT